MKWAAQFGISIHDFWAMTPHEIGVYVSGAGKRLEREYKRQHDTAMLAAYLTSRWVWAKKVDIKKHLITDTDKPTKAVQTDAEMLATVRMLNTAINSARPQ